MKSKSNRNLGQIALLMGTTAVLVALTVIIGFWLTR